MPCHLLPSESIILVKIPVIIMTAYSTVRGQGQFLNYDPVEHISFQLWLPDGMCMAWYGISAAQGEGHVVVDATTCPRLPVVNV